MEIEDLLSRLQALKIRLKVEDVELKIIAPKGTLTPELVNDIKTRKEEFITLLSSSDPIPKTKTKQYSISG